MAEKRFTIDPKDFTDDQWAELYNASTIMPRTYEQRHQARPFNRPRRYIVLAIECLENKATDILDGGLGPENHDGENDQWAEDLRGAAAQLAKLIGAPPKPGKQAARRRLYDLLTSDIYTDAPEYASRVAEVYELLPIVFAEVKN